MSKDNVDVKWCVEDDDEQVCATCGCSGPLTLHHLIPQVKCHNKYKEVKDDPKNHIMICRPCHDQIHALWTENQLRDCYNTLEKLLTDPRFKKFVEWKKKHPEFKGSSKMSNNKRKSR